MRCLYTLFLVFVCTISLAANPSATQGLDADRLSVLEDSLRELQLGVERNSLYLKNIENRVDNLVELQERAGANLSNELNASNRTISLYASLFAIVAVFLGVYVARMERKMKIMKGVVEVKQKEVQKLVDMINDNIDGLYERIHRADTVALLNRLTQVPKDIANISTRLLYSNLEERDFSLLKTAYELLVASGEENDTIGDLPVTFGERYLQQFFLHFLGKSIADPVLRGKIIPFFPEGIYSSFVNDIEKSTRDLALALANNRRSFDRATVLYEYRKALEYSKFSGMTSLSDILRNYIKDDVLWDDVETRLADYRNSPGIRPSVPAA